VPDRKKVAASPAQPDHGYSNRQRGAEIEDREHRLTHPHSPQLRSAYWSIVGDVPQLRPGDREGAKAVLHRVRAAIARGRWKRSEWRRLYGMEKKWLERSEGRDVRFNLFGNRNFGLTADQKKKLQHAEVVQQMLDTIDNLKESTQ
jgi:hypothetical protein